MIAHQNDREFFFHDYVDQIPRLCSIILVGNVCITELNEKHQSTFEAVFVKMVLIGNFRGSGH